MPESPIRKLMYLAERAEENNVHVHYLNIGQPDIETPENALEAVRNIDRKILEYSPSEGFVGLRNKLVDYYKGFDISVSSDQIIVTTGGSEAVIFAFMTCFDPGDEVIVPEPAYANYDAFAIEAGVVVKPIVTTIEDSFALPSVAEFEKLITPKTKGILICNPNNPTGYLYSQEEMDAICKLVKKHNLYLLCDEVYREFCYSDAPYVSSYHLDGIDDNVILIDSVSKRFSECGIRIGALVTRNKDVHAGVMKLCQARLSPPLLGQIVAEASFNNNKEFLKESHDEYKTRRDFLIEGLNKIEGVYSPMPMGAFYTIAQLPVDNSDKFCKWLLSDFKYKDETVFLAPASGFYLTPNKGTDQVRIAYVLGVPKLTKALKILEEALKVYPGRISNN